MLFGIAAVAVVGAMLYTSMRPSTLPSYLDQGSAGAEAGTLQTAMARAESASKPLLVFATADWCPPCKALKAGPLRDPAIESILTEDFEVFVLDLTDSNDAENQRLGQMLRVEVLPTMLIVEGGEAINAGRWTPRSGSFETWIRAQRDQRSGGRESGRGAAAG
jgi:thiol:disulfide interchange protein